jgi:hypothetical protein
MRRGSIFHYIYMPTLFHRLLPKIKQLLIHNLNHISLSIQFFPFFNILRNNHQLALLSIANCTSNLNPFKPRNKCWLKTVLIIFLIRFPPDINFSLICSCLHSHFICPNHSYPFIVTPILTFVYQFQVCALLSRM